MRWRASLGSVLLMIGLLPSSPGAAQQVCLALETQLAALERQSSEGIYQRLLADYEQARQAYDQIYRQADQMGCIPRLLRPRLPESCNGIRAQLDTRLTNLTAAQDRLRAADPGQSTAQRNNILRALAAADCGPQYEQFGNPGGLQLGGGALIDRLLGLPQGNGIIGDNLIPLVTTYRTLCVRPCDGYYFPISFSTTPAQFEADQRTCQAQCPDATLYVHRNPGEPVEAAVSVDGQAYPRLPNAFAFREAYHPECGCRPATIVVGEPKGNFTPIGDEVVARYAPTVPMPIPRPDPSEDPETIANRLGGLVPGAFTLPVAAATTDHVMVSADGTRLVGPAYYYAQ